MGLKTYDLDLQGQIGVRTSKFLGFHGDVIAFEPFKFELCFYHLQVSEEFKDWYLDLDHQG